MKGVTYKEGDWISLNGSTGDVFEGKLKVQDPDLTSGTFKTVMDWAD
jgi:pyruvate,orthophosphate dikinase